MILYHEFLSLFLKHPRENQAESGIWRTSYHSLSLLQSRPSPSLIPIENFFVVLLLLYPLERSTFDEKRVPWRRSMALIPKIFLSIAQVPLNRLVADLDSWLASQSGLLCKTLMTHCNGFECQKCSNRRRERDSMACKGKKNVFTQHAVFLIFQALFVCSVFWHTFQSLSAKCRAASVVDWKGFTAFTSLFLAAPLVQMKASSMSVWLEHILAQNLSFQLLSNMWNPTCLQPMMWEEFFLRCSNKCLWRETKSKETFSSFLIIGPRSGISILPLSVLITLALARIKVGKMADSTLVVALVLARPLWNPLTWWAWDPGWLSFNMGWVEVKLLELPFKPTQPEAAPKSWRRDLSLNMGWKKEVFFSYFLTFSCNGETIFCSWLKVNAKSRLDGHRIY